MIKLADTSTTLSVEARLRQGLLGQLPTAVETQESQIARCWRHLQSLPSPLLQNRYLYSVLDLSPSLFCRLVRAYLPELLPIIYTPTVGEAVQTFSRAFVRPRGLTLAWPHRAHLETMIEAAGQERVEVAVITDGERVLGLGDQGANGIEICLAKALTYAICADLNPARLLPICLDVGTDNPSLLNDPDYLGWRHPRIRGQAYDDFIEAVISTLQRKYPTLYLHWEDFGRNNARRLLERYQSRLCTFNDDLQGTGVVTLAAVLAAVEISGSPLTEQRIVIFGAGTAGTGVADQLCQAMQRQSLPEQEAQSRLWLLDRGGLIFVDSVGLADFQRPYARPLIEKRGYPSCNPDLLTVIQHIKPTLLIGCSGQGGAFSEAVVKAMAAEVERPIIFPLSNPTDNSEAHPQDLLNWTQGKALIATGSPFDAVSWQGQQWRIPQCNNAFAFPGIGLGVVESSATRVTDNMLWAACLALRDASLTLSVEGEAICLLPEVAQLQTVSRQIASAVSEAAREAGVGESPPP